MANAHKSLGELFSAIADAIRAKTGGTSQIAADSFPDAISAISAGTDTSDATAAAADVRQGKTFYAGGEKKTGSMAGTAVKTNYWTVDSEGYVSVNLTLSEGFAEEDMVFASGTQLSAQAAQTIMPGGTTQTIAAGKYLTGEQTIAGDANLVPANIKQVVSIYGVSGSFVGYANIEAGIHSGDGTNTATLETSFKPSYLVMASTVGHMAMNPKNSYLLLKLTAAGDGENNGTATYVRNPNGLQFFSGSATVSFSSSGTVVTLPSTYQFANAIQYYWAAWT